MIRLTISQQREDLRKKLSDKMKTELGISIKPIKTMSELNNNTNVIGTFKSAYNKFSNQKHLNY